MCRFQCRSLLTFCVLASLVTEARADEPNPAANPAPVQSGEKPERFQKFEQALSNVKFVGRFTVLGKEDGNLPKEEYHIKSVTKLPQGDYWLFQARIKYGDKDVTLPLPLEVKWAEVTPVITLSNLTLPGLGTFSSRVVIDGDKYAGTWLHGKVGGHLFGTIEKLEKETPNGN